MKKNTNQLLTNISRLFGLFMLIAVSLNINYSFASKGINLALSGDYMSFGVYSLDALEGNDIQGEEQAGFAKTNLNMHFNSENDAFILDAIAEVGRFIVEDRRISISIGIRPMFGTVKANKGSNTEEELSLLELAVGARFEFTSWITQAIKIKTEIFYFQTPNIASFGDFEDSNISGVRIAVPILGSSEAFVSYHHQKASTSDDLKLDVLDNVAFGIQMGF